MKKQRLTKRVFSIVIAIIMIAVMFCFNATAESNQTQIYVTIADQDGNLALIQSKTTVTDIDNDGKLTINDALYVAHEKNYQGGAEKGYGSQASDYGLSMTKLWGLEGGAFGYYLNNQPANGLSDEIKDGDSINAFVYKDTEGWSDRYVYFDVNNVTAVEGDTITLLLSGAGFDENWNPITLPVEAAVITIDGEATDYKTDANGNVTISIEKAGKYVISAKSDSSILVPTSCIATVEKKPVSPVVFITAGAVLLVVIAAGGVVFLKKKK